MLVNLSKLGLCFLVALQLAGCAPASQHPTLDGYQEGVVKSLASTTEAQITFINKSGQRVKVYWLDFDGQRVLYKVLQASESYDQQTFLTHPWLVTDANDNAWHIFYPSATPRAVTIVSPADKKRRL